MPDLIQALWKPSLHDLNATTFTTDEGYEYEVLEANRRWNEPLGKKLIILDVDTRIHTNTGDLMNTDPLYYKNLTGRTGGWMNHYLYAMIHGYDYRLVRAPEFSDRHGTWVKVPMIKEALKTHDMVVFLDADAVFVYPHLPFEWLLNLWNITDKTLLAMAEDPNSKGNRDSKGWVLWNTGFVVAQKSDRTMELFDNWQDCPSEDKYQGCAHWRKDWAHEQAAFGNHIRYDYSTTDDLRAIPCMDGNGSPYIGDKSCGGVFIRHHWFRKDAPIDHFKDMILDLMVRRLHGHFHSDLDTYFLDAHKKKYPLDLVL
ncbi:hypothetical protein BGZ63DRAFT_368002 [Mariannaea sp. PMI_226]|nr:hypothetical protein BGZ63DRAFT_368002 [Mariannaea sp. PMI_226]